MRGAIGLLLVTGLVAVACGAAEAPAARATPTPSSEPLSSAAGASATPTASASRSAVAATVRAEVLGTTNADGLPEYVVVFTDFAAGARAVFVSFTNARGQLVNPANPNYTITGSPFRARRALPDKSPAPSYLLHWTVDGVAYDVPLAFAAAQSPASPTAAPTVAVAARTPVPTLAPVPAPNEAPIVTPGPTAPPTLAPTPAQPSVYPNKTSFKLGENMIVIFRGFVLGSSITHDSMTQPDGRTYPQNFTYKTTADPYGISLSFEGNWFYGTYVDHWIVNLKKYDFTFTIGP